MSFPQYVRTDQIPGNDYDDFADVSFADLAKYANNCQDTDIDIAKCGRDLGTAGTTSGFESNVGLIDNTGYDKVNNVSGSSNNRKARVDIAVGLAALSGGSSSWLTKPTTNPFGGSITNGQMIKPTYLKWNSGWVWLWCEEDSVEYAQTITNTKVDRLMLGGGTGGQSLGVLPMTHGLVNEIDWSNTGYGSTYIDQTNVYGVPEGFAAKLVSVDSQLNIPNEPGPGQQYSNYYLWVGVGYRITSGTGFSSTVATGSGAWFGPYGTGTSSTATTNRTVNTYNSDLASMSNILNQLEDVFAPIDSYVAAQDNNFADFGIDIVLEATCYPL